MRNYLHISPAISERVRKCSQNNLIHKTRVCTFTFAPWVSALWDSCSLFVHQPFKSLLGLLSLVVAPEFEPFRVCLRVVFTHSAVHSKSRITHLDCFVNRIRSLFSLFSYSAGIYTIYTGLFIFIKKYRRVFNLWSPVVGCLKDFKVITATAFCLVGSIALHRSIFSFFGHFLILIATVDRKIPIEERWGNGGIYVLSSLPWWFISTVTRRSRQNIL